MFLLFLSGGQYLNTFEVSRAGAVKREGWRNSGEGGTGSLRLQRKQKDTGVDPEHSEATGGLPSVLRKRSGGPSRWKDQQEGWREGRNGENST